MGPFTYESKDGPIQTFSYYRAPERLLDDPDDLRAWVHRALAISKRDAAAKAKRKPKAAGGETKREAKEKGKAARPGTIAQQPPKARKPAATPKKR